MFKEVLNDVQSKEGKKVNLNILIQPTMKEEFDKLCKDNGTTMTSMMLGFIEKSLKDNPNYKKFAIEELEIEELTLEHKIDNLTMGLEALNTCDYEDDKQLVYEKFFYYKSIDFCTSQLEKVREVIYSDERKKERENYNKIRIDKLRQKEQTMKE